MKRLLYLLFILMAVCSVHGVSKNPFYKLAPKF